MQTKIYNLQVYIYYSMIQRQQFLFVYVGLIISADHAVKYLFQSLELLYHLNLHICWQQKKYVANELHVSLSAISRQLTFLRSRKNEIQTSPMV